MTDDILQVLKKYNCKAVIFDLDGTMLDNNPYHLKAWKNYLQKIGRDMTDEEYNANLNGRTNRDVMEYLYQRKMSDEEVLPYVLEKERLYRELYQQDIKPVAGLLEILQLLEDYQIPMAIATSGIQVNIDFMFDHVPVRKYFRAVVNSAHIKKGKPDPEIFLRTAEQLHVTAAECLVFEDSVVGIRSGKAAGMKVIAIATTQTKDELAIADSIIDDYRDLLPVKKLN